MLKLRVQGHDYVQIQGLYPLMAKFKGRLHYSDLPKAVQIQKAPPNAGQPDFFNFFLGHSNDVQ